MVRTLQYYIEVYGNSSLSGTFLYSKNLSRSKPVPSAGSAVPASKERKRKKLPRLEDFIQSRDFTGAITLLEVGKLL